MSLTAILRACAWTVFAFVLGAGVVAAHAAPREVEVQAAPDAGQALVEDLQVQGLECSGVPSLTDSIVFEFEDGTAEVLTFDEAWDAAEKNLGFVEAYCLTT